MILSMLKRQSTVGLILFLSVFGDGALLRELHYTLVPHSLRSGTLVHRARAEGIESSRLSQAASNRQEIASQEDEGESCNVSVARLEGSRTASTPKANVFNPLSPPTRSAKFVPVQVALLRRAPKTSPPA